MKGYYWLRDDGKQIYGLDGRPDKGANGMFETVKVKGLIDTLPEIPGLLLYHKDHCGIYIGNGWAVEAQSFSKGVVMTEVAKRRWTHWYRCPYIEYVAGAVGPDVPEPPTPPTPPTLNKPDPPASPLPDDQPDDDTPDQPDGDAPLDFGTRLLKYVKGNVRQRKQERERHL